VIVIQGGSNMTGTNCDLFTQKSSRSYLNHLVLPAYHILAKERHLKRRGRVLAQPHFSTRKETEANFNNERKYERAKN
jgi:hypothetical protein